MPSVSQAFVWLIVGMIAGSAAGIIVKGRRQGFGRLRNLALGLAGALVGGLIFNLFRLLPELDRIAISLRDIVAAMSGSALVLVAVWLGRKSREGDEP
ncbi:MAG: GlsB/YeaQ/YmgE family stress response membrane protein [bacterium]